MVQIPARQSDPPNPAKQEHVDVTSLQVPPLKQANPLFPQVTTK
jgi:hypothetical protein